MYGVHGIKRDMVNKNISINTMQCNHNTEIGNILQKMFFSRKKEEAKYIFIKINSKFKEYIFYIQYIFEYMFFFFLFLLFLFTKRTWISLNSCCCCAKVCVFVCVCMYNICYYISFRHPNRMEKAGENETNRNKIPNNKNNNKNSGKYFMFCFFISSIWFHANASTLILFKRVLLPFRTITLCKNGKGSIMAMFV